jgi:hypothetical protein
MPDHWVAGSFIGQEHTLKLIVLVLIVVSIVMFMVVLKTPLRTIRSVVFPDETASESQSTEPPDNAKAAKRDKVRKTNSTTSNNSGSKAGGSSSAPSVKKAEVDQPRTISAGGRASDRSLLLGQPLTISNDSVALYSINSTLGSVRTVLNKGTVVEPNLQVIDGDYSWTLVRVPELNMSGFVHTENLLNQRSGGSAR